MTYTVSKLAKASGVSVRTLHHYDELGLLRPSEVRSNGYRLYGANELARLQQVLFFKELEFSLDEIKEILDAPHFNMIEALKDHKKLIMLRQKRLTGLLETIDNTIKNMKNKKQMNDDELYGAFSKEEQEAYQKEAKERWGHTEAWKQSQERTKNWTKEDYAKLKKDTDVFMKAWVENMGKGVRSDEVQALVVQHHAGIEKFYDCPTSMYRNLGKMYVDDPRFTAFYDKYKKGLAQFVADAIDYYCTVEEMKKK